MAYYHRSQKYSRNLFHNSTKSDALLETARNPRLAVMNFKGTLHPENRTS